MKKFTLFFAACITCFLMLQLPQLNAQYSWSGTGDGLSPTTPYLISNQTDLEDLATAINNDATATYAGAYFVLTADINLSLSGGGWVPIGYYGLFGYFPFMGNFDGAGFTISNLWIDKPTEDCMGLFGCVDNATITNLKVEIDPANKVEGNNYVGGLVGYMSGAEITDCQVTGGDVKGLSMVGGFVGDAGQSIISKCYATNDVETTSTGYSAAGGFVGWADGNFNFSECFAMGNVTTVGQAAGGFAGILDTQNGIGTIENCYATGNASGELYAGGFCGLTRAGTSGNHLSISNCYAAANSVTITFGVAARGGFCGFIENIADVTFSNCCYDDKVGEIYPTGNCSSLSPTWTGISSVASCDMAGALPTSFSSSIWEVEPGSYPYFVGMPLPAFITATGLELTVTNYPTSIGCQKECFSATNVVTECGGTSVEGAQVYGTITLDDPSVAEFIKVTAWGTQAEYDDQVTNPGDVLTFGEHCGMAYFGDHIDGVTLTNGNILYFCIENKGGFTTPIDFVATIRIYEVGGGPDPIVEKVLPTATLTVLPTGITTMNFTPGFDPYPTEIKCEEVYDFGVKINAGCHTGDKAFAIVTLMPGAGVSCTDITDNIDIYYSPEEYDPYVWDYQLDFSVIDGCTVIYDPISMLTGFSLRDTSSFFRIVNKGVATEEIPFEVNIRLIDATTLGGTYDVWATFLLPEAKILPRPSMEDDGYFPPVVNCTDETQFNVTTHGGCYEGTMVLAKVIVDPPIATKYINVGFWEDVVTTTPDGYLEFDANGVAPYGRYQLPTDEGFSLRDATSYFTISNKRNAPTDTPFEVTIEIYPFEAFSGNVTSGFTFTGTPLVTHLLPTSEIEKCIQITANDIEVTALIEATDVLVISDTQGDDYPGLTALVEIEGNPFLFDVYHSILGDITFTYNPVTNITSTIIEPFTYTEYDLVIDRLTAAYPGVYPYTVALFEGVVELVRSEATLTVNMLPLTALDIELIAQEQKDNVPVITGTGPAGVEITDITAIVEIAGNPILTAEHPILTIDFVYDAVNDVTTATLPGFVYTDIDLELTWLKAMVIGKYPYTVKLLWGPDDVIIGQSEALLTVVCPASKEDLVNGITYGVKELAGHCWFTKNLSGLLYQNGTPIPFAKPYYHALYPDMAQNQLDFGLLYDFESAFPDPASNILICPEGWRIPTDEEFLALNMYNTKALKDNAHWLSPNENTNLEGFDSRGAGIYRSTFNKYQDLYGYTAYWSSTETITNTYGSAACLTYYCNYIEIVLIQKSDALSIRCIMEGATAGSTTPPVEPPVEKKVEVGVQSGTFEVGKEPIRPVEYNVTTTNIGLTEPGTLTWYDAADAVVSAPDFVTTTLLTDGSLPRVLSIEADYTLFVEGTYYFTLTIDGTVSNKQTLVVEPASTPPPPTCDDLGGVEINSVCWAKSNVDMPGTFATNPYDAGMFYQWNRNIGWTSEDPMENSDGGTTWNATEASGTIWEPENDPCPTGWRVPTLAELDKLTETANVDGVWTVNYSGSGVNGYLLTNVPDNGASLFLPASGVRTGTNGSLLSTGTFGYCYSNAVAVGTYAYYLFFNSGGDFYTNYLITRANADPVRCVLDE